MPALFAIRTLLAAWIALAVTTGAAAPQSPLCMSDAEFRAYLHEALLFQIGYGGAVCCARDTLRPGSCRLVRRQAARIEEIGAAYFQRNRATALRPFERAFPGRGEESFRRYQSVLEQRARKYVDGFGENECTSWLNAIEALSYLRESDLGAFLTTQLTPPAEFAEERKQIAACE